MSKGVQMAGGASLIALLLGWYGVSNLGAEAALRYYQNLAEFQAASVADGERARVHGFVAPDSIDSIERDVAARQVRFSVQNDPPHAGGEPGRPLEVVYGSLETPDLFKEGAEVVVEGRLVSAGAGSVFHADRVMAKCPSKFEPELTETAEF
jgi:cytochrome c-type biogenesis protein CcmE